MGDQVISRCETCGQWRRPRGRSGTGTACREDLARIALAIAEEYPGLLPTAVRDGQYVADVASGLIRKLAEKERSERWMATG